MKKMLILSFMSLFTILILVGCSPSEAKSQQPQPQTEETPTTETAVEVTPVATFETNWELVTTTDITIRNHVVGFYNDQLGVAVGYSGATSFTKDGGKTWTLTDNSSWCRYGLDILNETTMMSIGNSGQNLVSSDANEWTEVGNFPLKGGKFNKFLCYVDANTLYIGSEQTFGISRDGGATWENLSLPEGTTTISALYFTTIDCGYLLSKDFVLYKTVDGAKTWTNTPLELSDSTILVQGQATAALHFTDENNGILVVTTVDSKTRSFKTSDGGITWEEVGILGDTAKLIYISKDGQYLTLSKSGSAMLYKLSN